jgi:hypothetical protein
VRTLTTYTGRHISPLYLRPEQVDLADIAHALARKCRFGGHVLCSHYSVAQHCVIVSYAVPQQFALEALLHDACEYVLPDVIRPLKPHLFTLVGGVYLAMSALEDRVQYAIHCALGIAPTPDSHTAVSRADDEVALAEIRDLCHPNFIAVPEVACAGLTPWTHEIVPLAAETAETQFLERYAALKWRDE